MSVDRWEALREEVALGDGMGMDDELAEQVGSLLAAYDALAEREGKLRQALRKQAVMLNYCRLCLMRWPWPNGREAHAPDCLAKESP
jgi:hypothetical protein